MHRMVAVHQHPARLPYRRRAEPRAGPVGGADVEGNAGDADRRAGIMALDAEKRRRHGERRDGSHRYGAPGVNRNTAAATTQVQSPRGAPWAAATIECVSTMRLLIA